jgi:hypothetical protein
VSTPKRHHFVPKVLIKRFTDSDGWLHGFNKRDVSPVVRKSRLDNVFVQGHYYSEVNADGSRDAETELWLAQLEDKIDQIFQKIIIAVERNQLPQLSCMEKQTWVKFFITQWRRVPDLHDETRVKFAAQEFDNVVDNVKSRFPDRVDEIETVISDTHKARIIRNAYIRMLSLPPSEPERVLMDRGIVYLSTYGTAKSFIIGSRPVIQMNFQQGKTLADSSSEMWLPISTNVALGVGDPWEQEKLMHLNDPRLVRHLNISIARASTSFASCSHKLTASLANSM